MFRREKKSNLNCSEARILQLTFERKRMCKAGELQAYILHTSIAIFQWFVRNCSSNAFLLTSGLEIQAPMRSFRSQIKVTRSLYMYRELRAAVTCMERSCYLLRERTNCWASRIIFRPWINKKAFHRMTVQLSIVISLNCLSRILQGLVDYLRRARAHQSRHEQLSDIFEQLLRSVRILISRYSVQTQTRETFSVVLHLDILLRNVRL